MTPVVVGACEIAGAPVAPYGRFFCAITRTRAIWAKTAKNAQKKRYFR